VTSVLKVVKKIGPYRYASKKHKRTQKPPQYNVYQRYKPHLQVEFGRQCVYCLKPEYLNNPSAFHIDHYRPKSIPKFAHLVCFYDNLYYSCDACNRFKSDYWSDSKGKRIVNPCEFVASQHLKFVGATVSATSENGRITESILRLNNDNSVSNRKHILATIQVAVRTLVQRPSNMSASTKSEYDMLVDQLLTTLSEICSIPKDKLSRLLRL